MTKKYLVSSGSTIKWTDSDGKEYAVTILEDFDPLSPREDDGNLTEMACFHPRYTLGDAIGTKSPEEYWRKLVREHVIYNEIEKKAWEGLLPGFRLAKTPGNEKFVDIYETTYIGGLPPTDNSNAVEELAYSGVDPMALTDYLIEDMPISVCQLLMRPYAEWLPLWLYDHSGLTISCSDRNYPYNDRWDSSQVGWIIVLKENVVKNFGEDKWRARAMNAIKNDVHVYDQYLRGEVFCFTLYEKTGEDWDEIDSCSGWYGDDIVENEMVNEIGHGLYEAILDGRDTVRPTKYRKVPILD